jgi:hypothetical protein
VFTDYNLANLPEGLPEQVRAEVVALIRERDTPGAGDFSRAGHMVFGNYKLSKELQIEASGELVVYQDGGQLRITRRSAYNRKIALLIESNPVGQSRPKIRKVPSAFKKKPRPRTEAELEGLRRGNARRAEEARLRRGKVSAAEGGDISSR